MDEHVVPVAQVQAVAGQVAVIVAIALVQARGDATDAVGRLEGMRGKVNVHAESDGGFRMDVVQAAQEAINQAAQITEAGEPHG